MAMTENYPPLRDLHVRLVAKCNLNCQHCYASDWFIRSDQLETELVASAIDQAMELGLEKVTFTGGEPTLHKDVAYLLEHCVAKGLRCKLETNGLLLGHHDARVRDLIVANKNLIYLYISYDLASQRGITEEEHRSIRDLAIYLHEHGVDVRLQTTLTQVNIRELDTLLELPRKYGIHQRIFLGHSVSGNGASLTPFDFDFVLATYRYLRGLNLNLDLELPPLISGSVQKGCGWGVYRCEVMANGDVTTCGPTTFTNTGFIAGNLREKKIREIWLESPYFHGMREIRQSDFEGVCGRCVFWEECRGSCRSVAWSRGETWFSPYPLCELFAQRYPEEARPHLFPEPPPRTDGLAKVPSGTRAAATALPILQ